MDKCMYCGEPVEFDFSCDSCYTLFDPFADQDYALLFLGDMRITNLELAYLDSLIPDNEPLPF